MAGGKYQEWLTEEGLLKVSAWARRGLSNEQIAENIGVSRKTFQEWLKKFPELKDAVKNSKEVADIHVENALFKKCLGYTVTVKKNMKIRTEGGIEEIVPVEEEVYVSPDVNAQKFWLQHRKVEDWGKAVEEQSPEDEGGVVEIPGITPSVKSDGSDNPSVSGADSSLCTREPLGEGGDE